MLKKQESVKIQRGMKWNHDCFLFSRAGFVVNPQTLKDSLDFDHMVTSLTDLVTARMHIMARKHPATIIQPHPPSSGIVTPGISLSSSGLSSLVAAIAPSQSQRRLRPDTSDAGGQRSAPQRRPVMSECAARFHWPVYGNMQRPPPRSTRSFFTSSFLLSVKTQKPQIEKKHFSTGWVKHNLEVPAGSNKTQKVTDRRPTGLLAH